MPNSITLSGLLYRDFSKWLWKFSSYLISSIFFKNLFKSSRSRGCGNCGKVTYCLYIGAAVANNYLWKTCGKVQMFSTGFDMSYFFSTLSSRLSSRFPQVFHRKKVVFHRKILCTSLRLRSIFSAVRSRLSYIWSAIALMLWALC